jgi:hypothetical protein
MILLILIELLVGISGLFKKLRTFTKMVGSLVNNSEDVFIMGLIRSSENEYGLYSSLFVVTIIVVELLLCSYSKDLEVFCSSG